jgi:DNA primase
MSLAEDTSRRVLSEAYAMLDSADNPEKKHAAINRLCQALAVMEKTLQALTIDSIKEKYKIPKKLITDTLKGFSNGNISEAEFVNENARDEIQEFGFYEENNKYIFLTKDGTVDGSNFVIVPLFHIYSKSDNKRLIKIINEHGYERIIDIPSQKFVSFEQFQQMVYGEGNYLFFGNGHQFKKILSKISDKYPICNELKTMGWQREGFFAFANGIYADRKWQPTDDLGITEFDEKKYFSPAFSKVYQDVREDDDDYENDRYFVFKPSPVSFNDWCSRMNKVYTDKAPWGISYFIASLFRDIIYEKFKFFPLLFLFGQPQSGKSAMAWSLSNAFFHNLPAYNLNSGTVVGFFRRLARFRNTISWFDEYHNEIDKVKFEALKASYDGIGHEKGRKTQDNRTTVTKVNAAIVVSGQYLPTINDNALLTRSILLSFPKRDNNNPFTKQEIDNLNALRELEKDGISGIITEVLRHRQTVEREFPSTYNEVYNSVKNYFVERKFQYTERIINNYICMLTVVKIFQTYVSEVKLGFTYETLYSIALKMILKQSSQISESDSLSTMWATIQYLYEQKQIHHEIDFKIRVCNNLNLMDGKEMSFANPRKILFMRFSKIHPLYLEAHRKQTGQNGVDITSMRHYISNHVSYLGLVKAMRFENATTSAYCFDYNDLKQHLEAVGFDLDSDNSSEPTILTPEESDTNGMGTNTEYLPF